MKASKKLITFYKSQVVSPIHKKMLSDGADVTIEAVDSILKHRSGYEFSTTKMTTEELQELIVWSFQFADSIGLTLDYLPSELDNELNFKDLK